MRRDDKRLWRRVLDEHSHSHAGEGTPVRYLTRTAKRLTVTDQRAKRGRRRGGHVRCVVRTGCCRTFRTSPRRALRGRRKVCHQFWEFEIIDQADTVVLRRAGPPTADELLDKFNKFPSRDAHTSRLDGLL